MRLTLVALINQLHFVVYKLAKRKRDLRNKNRGCCPQYLCPGDWSSSFLALQGVTKLGENYIKHAPVRYAISSRTVDLLAILTVSLVPAFSQSARNQLLYCWPKGDRCTIEQ